MAEYINGCLTPGILSAGCSGRANVDGTSLPIGAANILLTAPPYPHFAAPAFVLT